MSKSIRIFKSFKVQQPYHKEWVLQSTVEMRFRKLYQMQQLNPLLHSDADTTRKIQIRKWTS